VSEIHSLLRNLLRIANSRFLHEFTSQFIYFSLYLLSISIRSRSLACFRDDVVFIIYLYQRYLYPVDRSRVNEYGESFDDSAPADKRIKDESPEDKEESKKTR
jgi:hypothetical protein